MPQYKGSELLGGTWSDGPKSWGAARSGKVSALPSVSFSKIPTEESKQDIMIFLTFKYQKKTWFIRPSRNNFHSYSMHFKIWK